MITKTSGQFGTSNPVIHTEVITKGKNIGRSNETTHFEQAVLQAESDWNKKRDEGYKSLDDLGISVVSTSPNRKIYSYPVPPGHSSFPNSSSEYTPSGLATALEVKLPQSNTDASGNIKPMLATDVEKIKKIDYPVYVQPKFDGFRCLITVEGDQVTLLSRSGKPFDLPHIADAFKGKGLHVVLDGELYLHGVSFQSVSKAIKKPNELTPNISYYCYDVAEFILNQMDRLTLRNVALSKVNHPNIKDVQGTLAHNREEITELHDGFVTMGYEGAMVRLTQGKYVSSRSRELIKVKQFNDEEFEFLGWELGQRGTEDLIAICRTKDGATFNAKMMGTREHKQDLFNSDAQMGDQLTVKFFGYSEDGIPRFPVGKAFREY